MPKTIPESTKTSLGQRLRARQRERWPALAGVHARFRGPFAYVDGELNSGELLPLCRLRYAGSASLWGFAIHLASTDGYQDSVLPGGLPVGTPEEALDCACGLYLADPTAWQEHLPPASSWPIIGAGLSGPCWPVRVLHVLRTARSHGAWRSLMRQVLSEGSDAVKAVVVPIAGHHGII